MIKERLKNLDYFYFKLLTNLKSMLLNPMAIVSKSIDEVTDELADIFDELIAPQKIWRNNNNKAYLMLRAYAAGHVALLDSVLALHNRFDPAYCDELDLLSTAKLVGTELMQGTGSMLTIDITNNYDQPLVLPLGVYHHISTSGDIFAFEVMNGRQSDFEAGEVKQITAVSIEKGSYRVTGNSNIQIFRPDGVSINPRFSFSCRDNISQLGYPDEDLKTFRTRILKDSERQDILKELELKIRNLPNILECDIIFNEGLTALLYDGINLQPKELLLTITGVPTDEVAEIVCKNTIYDTHECDPNDVLYYYNDSYLNGRKPVYYREHGKLNFSVKVEYQYDPIKLRSAQIEAEIDRLFKPYMDMVTRLSTFGEKDAYTVLTQLNLPAVEILNADIIDESGNIVSFVTIPKTKLPNLTRVVYISYEKEGLL